MEEDENTVPTDITRRRVLADILSIPPVLFGLASIEDVIFKAQEETQVVSLSTTPYITKQAHIAVSVVEQHQKNLLLYWRLDNTSTAEASLNDIYASIQELDELAYQVRGNLQRKVQELLFGYYRLATTVLIDKKKCARAFSCANKMVELARSLERKELLATAQHTRGFVNLLWGMGDPGVTDLDYEKIRLAVSDFEAANSFAHSSLKGVVLTDLGRAKALLKESVIDITIAQKTIEQAGKMVGRETTEDPYMSIFFGEPLRVFNKGRYHIGKAVILTSVGRSDKALEELRYAEEGVGRDQVRRHAWIDVTRSQAYMGLKEYQAAVYHAKKAFVVCRDINSVGNIAAIKDMYRDLCQSSYKNTSDVKELGLMLSSYCLLT